MEFRTGVLSQNTFRFLHYVCSIAEIMGAHKPCSQIQNLEERAWNKSEKVQDQETYPPTSKHDARLQTKKVQYQT